MISSALEKSCGWENPVSGACDGGCEVFYMSVAPALFWPAV